MRSNCWIIAVWAIASIAVAECSWGAPGDGQYHIQTDEGPERYFRFQTDNGQFRKEKRLQDGTVIGTEAWIDAAGFLRQKDYIADKEGYRILKSKTVFVGYGRQIEDAIKSTKSVPAQSGVSVDGGNGLHARTNSVGAQAQVNSRHDSYVPVTTTTTPIPPTSPPTTAAAPALPGAEAGEGGKLNYLSPEEAAKIEPSSNLGFDHYPDELPHPQPQHTRARPPLVHIRPHSEPIEAHSNSIADDYEQVGTTTYHPPLAAPRRPSMPSLAIEPPFESSRRVLRPVALATTRPPPIAAQPNPAGYSYSTPAPFPTPTASASASASASATPRTPSDGYYYQRATTPATYSAADYADADYPLTTARPSLPLQVNNLEDGLLPPLPPPTRRRLRPAQAHSDVLNAVDYDGVGVTRNGFRYFLPRHYHEEETFDEDNKRAGSYGYVDPFGIRRVVYYNASPGRGFVHRNNNRYVGLGATPYDPVASL